MPTQATSTLAMDRLLNRALALLDDDSRHPGIWGMAWAQHGIGMGYEHGQGRACHMYSTVVYSTHPIPSRHQSQSQDDSNDPPPSSSPTLAAEQLPEG